MLSGGKGVNGQANGRRDDAISIDLLRIAPRVYAELSAVYICAK